MIIVNQWNAKWQLYGNKVSTQVSSETYGGILYQPKYHCKVTYFTMLQFYSVLYSIMVLYYTKSYLFPY